jgi:hypothetical protein
MVGRVVFMREIKFWSEDLKARDHMVDLGITGGY